MLVREPQMSLGKHNHHASRVRVHVRLLMRPIVYVHDLYAIVFKSQLIVRGFDLGRVLGKRHGERKHDEYRGAEG